MFISHLGILELRASLSPELQCFCLKESVLFPELWKLEGSHNELELSSHRALFGPAFPLWDQGGP